MRPGFILMRIGAKEFIVWSKLCDCIQILNLSIGGEYVIQAGRATKQKYEYIFVSWGKIISMFNIESTSQVHLHGWFLVKCNLVGKYPFKSYHSEFLHWHSYNQCDCPNIVKAMLKNVGKWVIQSHSSAGNSNITKPKHNITACITYGVNPASAVCEKQAFSACIRNDTPHYLWDIISYAFPRYLLLAHISSYAVRWDI